jgi:hypothetical protein
MSMPLSFFLEDVERNEVDLVKVRSFERESEHSELAFNLFRETAQYVCILANTAVGDQPAWDRGGHLVRMFKLMRFFLEEAIHNRAELIWVITRLLAECIINFRFLLEHSRHEVFESYMYQSLQHENELRDLINKNINDRGGRSFPIEHRMLASIEQTFEKSEVEIDALPKKKIRNWAEMNLYEKARSVDLGEAYLAIFGGPSRNVHGGWQDLLQHHLDCDHPGKFTHHLDFHLPRPQIAFTLSALIAPTLTRYVTSLNHPALDPSRKYLQNLEERIRLADELHEEFLAKRSCKK